jgi:hypothetical protein
LKHETTSPVGEREYSKTPVLDGKRAAGKLRNQAERASSNMCDPAVYARDLALALAKTDNPSSYRKSLLRNAWT